MIKNSYRVPKDRWTTWTETARRVFNMTYRFMMENQWAMLHPKQEPPKPAHWKTTSWNSAWVAADAADNEIPSLVH